MGLIRETFEIVTEESAADGDVADRGWIDEEGVALCLADAVKYLERHYVTSASSSHFHRGVWYSTEAEQDPQTGAHETRSFHLDGFTMNQERRIFDAVTKHNFAF